MKNTEFDLDFDDSINSPELFKAALNSEFVDDTYVELKFLVEKPKITISPIGEHTVDSKFEISGTTNMMIDQNNLFVEVKSSSFNSKDNPWGSMGVVPIQKGTDGLNRWSYEVDSSHFRPDEYIVKVSALNGKVFEQALFEMVETGR